MRKVAADPDGPETRDRAELLRGLRSLHIRQVRRGGPGPMVGRPVHVIYYRVIEIVRVLHERMEPCRHVGARSEAPD